MNTEQWSLIMYCYVNFVLKVDELWKAPSIERGKELTLKRKELTQRAISQDRETVTSLCGMVPVDSVNDTASIPVKIIILKQREKQPWNYNYERSISPVVNFMVMFMLIFKAVAVASWVDLYYRILKSLSVTMGRSGVTKENTKKQEEH